MKKFAVMVNDPKVQEIRNYVAYGEDRERALGMARDMAKHDGISNPEFVSVIDITRMEYAFGC